MGLLELLGQLVQQVPVGFLGVQDQRALQGLLEVSEPKVNKAQQVLQDLRDLLVQQVQLEAVDCQDHREGQGQLEQVVFLEALVRLD